jgi:hypothetical protein
LTAEVTTSSGRFAVGPLRSSTVAAEKDVMSVMGICSFVGLCVGGYLPVLAWGASDLGFQSLLFGVIGGVGGVWVGHRLTN